MGGYIKDYKIKLQECQHQCHCVLYNYPYFVYYLREDGHVVGRHTQQCRYLPSSRDFPRDKSRKIRNAFTVYPIQSTCAHLRNILNFSTFAVLGLSLAATYWPGHMIPRGEVVLCSSNCDRDTYCPQIHRIMIDITVHSNNGTVITFLIVSTNVYQWTPSSATHAVQSTTLCPISIRYLNIITPRTQSPNFTLPILGTRTHYFIRSY